jgi:ubiquinone/menaquinone biosynthesis C-methylase UbiE/DNA-binding transcriptional ArsR family regulator
MDELLATLRALGDPTRLRIAAVLQEGAFNVNELVSILGMGQSRVSRHLKILLDAGLVAARREGTWTYYGLAPAWRAERGREAAVDALPQLAGSAESPAESSNTPRAETQRPILVALAAELASRIEAERPRLDTCYDRRRSRAEVFFRGVAPAWDKHRDTVLGPPDYLERLVEDVAGSGVVVDLGTGTGVLVPVLAARVGKVLGIDASAEMLAVARDRTRGAGLHNVEFRLGALEHLPLSDGEADAMVANMVFHHVAEPVAALREVRRGLRAGGKLVVADFLAHGREDYRETLGDLWLGFDPEEFRAWARSAGLEPLAISEIPVALPSDPAVFLFAARKLQGAEGRESTAQGSDSARPGWTTETAPSGATPLRG